MPETGPPAGSTTVKASFSLPVGGGYLNASVQVPSGRTTLTELLPIIQNLDNAIVGRVIEEAQANGTPISCRAGCSACCRQFVSVNLFEAEAILDWIRSQPEERQAEIEARFQRALARLNAAGVIERILDPDWLLNEGLVKKMASDYFHAGVPCPFLENDRCGIYPIRPLVCREHMVTSPAELCQDPARYEARAVRFPLRLSHVLYAIGRDLTDDPRGWIPLVFLLGWAKKGGRQGERVSGSGEEILRMFLEQAMKEAETAKETEAEKTE